MQHLQRLTQELEECRHHVAEETEQFNVMKRELLNCTNGMKSEVNCLQEELQNAKALGVLQKQQLEALQGDLSTANLSNSKHLTEIEHLKGALKKSQTNEMLLREQIKVHDERSQKLVKLEGLNKEMLADI